ncbi:A24 family peptidase [Desulfurispora thermophila]|uniref:A24 family peptidase n=1 Tax=Desulfurispora thermophila TaxID=265470 RepID=UPI000379351C|nr:prepilin peptidase [Desulfurispora thermophila]
MLPKAILLTTIVASIYTDLKYRKIYNAVLLPSFMAALLYHTFSAGTNGLLFSIKGAALGLALLLIPFMLGGMGAGDVKLLAVIGAWQGANFVWLCFLLTALAGGAIATVQLVKQRRFWLTLQYIVLLFVPGTPKKGALGTLATSRAGETFPYGVAIAAGTLATYLMR